jgi:hypothetical protein
MVSPLLVKNDEELREFYEWLLCRAHEMEAEGNKNHSRLYKEYADTIKIKMNCPEADLILQYTLGGVSYKISL